MFITSTNVRFLCKEPIVGLKIFNGDTLKKRVQMTFASEGHFNLFSNKINSWLGVSVNSSYPIELQVANTQSQLLLPAQAPSQTPSQPQTQTEKHICSLSVCASQIQFLQLKVQATSSSQAALSQLKFAPTAEPKGNNFSKESLEKSVEESVDGVVGARLSADETCDGGLSNGKRGEKPRLRLQFEDQNSNVSPSKLSKSLPQEPSGSGNSITVKVEEFEPDLRYTHEQVHNENQLNFHNFQNFNSQNIGYSNFGPSFPSNVFPPANTYLTETSFTESSQHASGGPFDANTSNASVFNLSRPSNDHTLNTTASFDENNEQHNLPAITQNDIARALQDYSSNSKSKKRKLMAVDTIEDALISTIKQITNREQNSIVELSDEKLCLKIARKLNSSSFAKVLHRIESIIVPSYELEYQE